jgi:ABC-type branched-subunit amino acid transport system ATPase component
LDSLAESPLALETHGTNLSVLKVIVFCVASSMAAMAGALYAMVFHFGLGSYFPSFNSLTLVALVVIVTVGDPWYAIIGAIGYSVVPSYVSGETTSSVLNLIFGIGAVTVVYSLRSAGMPQRLRMLMDKFGGVSKPGTGTKIGSLSRTLARSGAQAIESSESPGGGLSVTKLTVRFGGVRAVDGLNIEARVGHITGLIGPNGAGKSTTFNACSGLIRSASGRITLHDRDVTRLGPARRAGHGLGRTFQRTELFEGMTVRENVAVGREAGLAGANPLTHLFGTRSASRAVDAAVEQALALTGTEAIADRQAGTLTIGQRRLVELARVLAGPFDMLLLDEPSSGLDGNETTRFGEILSAVVHSRQCGILLVEHDMALVRAVCDYVYVLDFGRLIFEGTPAQMQRSDIVRAAYLGDSSDAGLISASGEDEQAALVGHGDPGTSSRLEG